MLDSQAFPHILDLIVAFAPPSSLLALRACSRYLHDRADSRLFKHLEVVFPTDAVADDDGTHIYPDSAIDVAVRPRGSNIRFEWLRTERPNGPDGTATAQDLDARAALRAYIHTQVTSAKTLDLLWTLYGDCSLASLSAVEACLATDGIWDQTTIRCFGQPGGFHNLDYNSLPEFDKFETAYTQVHFGYILGRFGYKRLVRSLLCFPGEVAAGRHLRLFGGRSYEVPNIARRELVVHLLSTDDPAYRVLHTGRRFLHTLIDELFPDEEGSGIPTIVTVVGGAAECRGSLGLPATASLDAFYSALRKLAPITFLFRVYDPESNSSEWQTVTDVEAHLREHFVFRTPEEYENQVGAEQVALETKPDPFTGPPATYIP